MKAKFLIGVALMSLMATSSMAVQLVTYDFQMNKDGVTESKTTLESTEGSPVNVSSGELTSDGVLLEGFNVKLTPELIGIKRFTAVDIKIKENPDSEVYNSRVVVSSEFGVPVKLDFKGYEIHLKAKSGN